LASQYQAEFTDLQNYMDGWYQAHGTMVGIQFTPEQQQFIETYAHEVQSLYIQQSAQPHQPQQPRFWGINGIFDSRYQIPGPDGNLYSCRMFCFNHNWTTFWGDLIWNMGFMPAFFTFGAIMLIVLGLVNIWLWIIIMDWIWDQWRDIRDFLQLYQGQSGTLFYRWFGYLPEWKYQPDPVNDRWIYVDGTWIPNPAIWSQTFP
jgi:hypothetical protein